MENTNLSDIGHAIVNWSYANPFWSAASIGGLILLMLTPTLIPIAQYYVRKTYLYWKFRIRRKQIMGRFRKLSVQTAIADAVVDAVDKVYLRGEIDDKQRQQIFFDLGVALVVADLVPRKVPRRISGAQAEYMKSLIRGRIANADQKLERQRTEAAIAAVKPTKRPRLKLIAGTTAA
jgi:hypothetical protein